MGGGGKKKHFIGDVSQSPSHWVYGSRVPVAGFSDQGLGEGLLVDATVLATPITSTHTSLQEVPKS